MDEDPNGIMADTLLTGTTLVEKESRSIGDAPVGTILAWAKTLSGVPNLAEGWVECDGAVLIDALSPLNGQTIPDLNGDNRFLRGNSTSGGVGGSATASHTHQCDFLNEDSGDLYLPDIMPDGNLSSQGSERKIDTTASSSSTRNKVPTESAAPAILPPYYNIVWIMRVR